MAFFTVCNLVYSHSGGYWSWHNHCPTVSTHWMLSLLLEVLWEMWSKQLQIQDQIRAHQVYHSVHHFPFGSFAAIVSCFAKYLLLWLIAQCIIVVLYIVLTVLESFLGF